MVLALHDKKVIDIAGGFYHSILLVKHKKSNQGSQLSSDMKKIINDPTRCDVTFLVEGKPLHAHRCILFARCRSLEEKVRLQGRKSDDRDKNKWSINHPNHSILEIPNVKHKSFLALIEYIYTDTIRSLKNNQNEELMEIEQLLDLLQLCSEFRIVKLTQFCKEAIEPCITVDNCCIVLKKVCDLAGSDIEGEETLRLACMSFILANF
mmetsp:Transcript_5769/g.5232  ORF Transcript_5769/g.5232 Transcript_5769/m.5232 type:complete len:208 (+) Transcript_5769:151-774(+)